MQNSKLLIQVIQKGKKKRNCSQHPCKGSKENFETFKLFHCLNIKECYNNQVEFFVFWESWK